MAENQNATPAPVATDPTAEAAPVDHILPAADQNPIANVLNGLAGADQAKPADPQPTPEHPAEKPKNDGPFKPTGSITGCP